MTHTPAAAVSQHNPSKAPDTGKTVSLIQENAKKELFSAIDAQNMLYSDWQKSVQQWFDEKVAKREKRGKKKGEAEKLASEQIKNTWKNIYKDKMATPGTASGNTYKQIGDSDGEGSLFLMKKFVVGKKTMSVDYPSHEKIEKDVASTDLKDAATLKFFLDGGQVAGMKIQSGEGTGLHSAWKNTKMVLDHHPEGPTSTTGMMATLLNLTHIIPASEKKTVEKFVRTIDIVDSFLSKAGRTLDVEKSYAKTLIAFSYMLDSEQLYNLCSKLPDNVGPLTPLSDELLTTIDVIAKDKKEPVKLIELTKKKQANVRKGKEIVDEKIKQKHFITIDGKKFVIFGPKDQISNDVRALLSAEKDFGTIKIHETGDLFAVHDEGIPKELQTLGLTVRNVILIMNEKNSKDFIANKEKLIAASRGDEGIKYLNTLLQKELLMKKEKDNTEKKEIKEIVETIEKENKNTETKAIPEEIKKIEKDIEKKIEKEIQKTEIEKYENKNVFWKTIKQKFSSTSKWLKDKRNTLLERAKGLFSKK